MHLKGGSPGLLVDSEDRGFWRNWLILVVADSQLINRLLFQ
jgi:hypothetical protein